MASVRSDITAVPLTSDHVPVPAAAIVKLAVSQQSADWLGPASVEGTSETTTSSVQAPSPNENLYSPPSVNPLNTVALFAGVAIVTFPGPLMLVQFPSPDALRFIVVVPRSTHTKD